MKVLMIADAADGFLDVALRAERNGHQVKIFIRRYDPQKRPIGKGLVNRVHDWREHIRWCDICLLESNTVYMTELDRWRKEGVPIIGGGVESASWEIERSVGMRVFKRAGIPIPDYREFTDYESAIAFVKRRDMAYVSKPCGPVDDKSLSYVAKSPEDLLFMLGRWKRKHGGRPPCPFILQDKIMGIEFAVGGWYGPGGFALGWEENFEHKKLFPGDLGPNTGELGTVMRLVRRSRLADKVLVPLAEQLEQIQYCGNIDVNCIIDEDGNPWPLEFTMRFGWPAFNIELSLHKTDFIEFLGGVANGSAPTGSRALGTVAVGVVLAIPDFPYSHATRKEVIGLPIWGPTDDEDWHPCEVMAGTDTAQASAGDYIGVATATGDNVRSAARAVYRFLDQLSMPASPFYRNDIGKRLARDLPRLQESGFASDMEY